MISPPLEEDLPKHPSLFLHGSREARHILQPREFSGIIGVTHFHTLPSISAILHVEWYPALIHALTDELDMTFGFLHSQISSHSPKEWNGEQEKPIAAIYQQLLQSLMMKKEEAESCAWACVTISNIYHLLRMCEIVLSEEREIRDVLPLFNHSSSSSSSSNNSNSSSSNTNVSALPNHPILSSLQTRKLYGFVSTASMHSLSLTIPIFGAIAQHIAEDDVVDSLVPSFVDSIVASLAVSESIRHLNDNPRTVDGVIFTLAFLLLSSHSLNQFVDGSKCMQVSYS